MLLLLFVFFKFVKRRVVSLVGTTLQEVGGGERRWNGGWGTDADVGFIWFV